VENLIDNAVVNQYHFKYSKCKEASLMANKTFTLNSLAMGIIAIVAGVLVMWQWWIAQYIIGIFLIVWGILTIVNNK
jgi:uncharacterized membrane protein HdeD (DUF308 family)